MNVPLPSSTTAFPRTAKPVQASNRRRFPSWLGGVGLLLLLTSHLLVAGCGDDQATAQPTVETPSVPGDEAAVPQDATLETGRRLAVTIDDLPSTRRLPLAELETLTHKLLEQMAKHGVESTGFVNSGKLEATGDNAAADADQDREARIAVLRQWLEAGHELANHTASHPSLSDVGAAAFQKDILAGEPLLHQLLEERGETLRYFRHPYLRTGRTVDQRQAVDTFLDQRGYTVVPVTLENDDWVFAPPYQRALRNGDAALAQKIADAYLDHTVERVAYWEAVSQASFGRQIAHTLLLHANQLNADHLDRLLTRLAKRGYRFISLEEALADPAYESTDTWVGRYGPNWLYRWAVSDSETAWPHGPEPEPPAWVSAR